MKVLLLWLACCAPLCAQGVVVGEKAPPFRVGGNAVNPYHDMTAPAHCLGDVVVVLEWNVRDGDSLKRLVKLSETWSKFGERGLWVFAVHRLRETPRQVQRFLIEKGWTFCVPMGGFYDDDNEFANYRHSDNVWGITVIGADGNVLYHGRGDFDTPLQAELKKQTYTGLGKEKVHPKVHKAAHFFGQRKFGMAMSDAEKLVVDNEPEEVRNDAQWILDRAGATAKRRSDRIRAWVDDKRLDLAVPALEALFSDFKGHEISKEAKIQLDALKAEKTFRPEMKAFDQLKKLVDEKYPQGDDQLIPALKKFATDNERFRAGGAALEMARKIERDSEKREGQ